MEAMSYIAAEIGAAGASLVAVSPKPRSSLSLCTISTKLAFPLLVDGGNQCARQFGLGYRVSDEQQGLYRSTFVNLRAREWRFQLGVGDSGNFCDRPRRHVFCSPSANEDYIMDRPEPLEILSVVES